MTDLANLNQESHFEFPVQVAAQQNTPDNCFENEEVDVGEDFQTTLATSFQAPDPQLIRDVLAAQEEFAALLNENILQKIEPYLLVEVKKLIKKAGNLLKLGPGLRILKPVQLRPPQETNPNKKFAKQPAFKHTKKSRTAAMKKKNEIIEVSKYIVFKNLASVALNQPICSLFCRLQYESGPRSTLLP